LFFRSSHSPESGVGSQASHDSEVERLYANAEAELEAEVVVVDGGGGVDVAGGGGGVDDEDDTLNGEFYENELLPILGTCRALYAFEGAFFFLSSSFYLVLPSLAKFSSGLSMLTRLYLI